MGWIIGRTDIQSHYEVTLANIKTTDVDVSEEVIISATLKPLVATPDPLAKRQAL